MSMIRSAKLALIALSVLAFPSVSHAETPAGNQGGHSVLTGVNTNNNVSRVPVVATSDRELDCLARNIYHESRGEPREGKYAVGLVTLNRVRDNRFPNSVCGVVNQRTRSVCQFSWRCHGVTPPRASDPVWQECRRIAARLLNEPGFYASLRQRYGNIIFFHEQRVRPSWARAKVMVARVGAHLFYR